MWTYAPLASRSLESFIAQRRMPLSIDTSNFDIQGREVEFQMGDSLDQGRGWRQPLGNPNGQYGRLATAAGGHLPLIKAKSTSNAAKRTAPRTTFQLSVM